MLELLVIPQIVEHGVQQGVIKAMSSKAIDNVRKLEIENKQQPQLKISTHHLFHAGIYARTIKLEAGTLLTGALIKRATILIVSGHCIVYVDGEAIELQGYNVFAASAGRKQAFVAKSDVDMTMMFATDAKSVLEAEDEFTDEGAELFSRHGNINHVIITGE